jgi:hypothetical protein
MPEDGDSVVCRVTSSDTCATNNPALSDPVVMTVSPSVPAAISLLNFTVANGSQVCYNATQEIIVSSDMSTYVVQAGGSATMIAGQRIVFLQGTTVEPGGYLHGYIAPGGPWCGPGISKAAAAGGDDGQNPAPWHAGEKSFFSVFPNPTRGTFSLRLTGEETSTPFSIEVYGMHGDRVLSANLNGTGLYEFSLSGKPDGVYFIRIVSPDKAGTGKIIKH